MCESMYEYIKVPVFRPNENEFSDFSRLIGRIEVDPNVMAAGLAKVRCFKMYIKHLSIIFEL